MYLWKQKEGVEKLREATIANPKLKHLLKYKLEDQEEIVNVFLKVKGNAMPYYDSIMNVEYYKISNIKKIVSKDTDLFDTIEIVRIITGLCYKKIVKLRTLDIIKIHNFVKTGIEDIIKLEKTLSRKHDAAEIKAGIERMNKFGEMISVKSVMDFYNESWELVEKRPYIQFFAIWSMNSEKSEFDKNYFKIKTAKKK